MSRPRAIRLAHVITGLSQGGAEAFLVRLLSGLKCAGYEQSVISLTDRGCYGDEIEASGIPVRSLGMQSMAGILKGGGIYSALRGLKPDIVQTWLYHADLLGLLAARFAGPSAVVWNVRCATLDPGDVPNSTRMLVCLLARMSHWPDAILFNSSAGLAAHHMIDYRPRRSEVIPNGFDLDEWRPDADRRARFRAEIGVADDGFVIGMVGRYHRMKDHSCFLSAAARIRSLRDDARFVLIGTNVAWDNEDLAANIDRLGLRDSVMLLGPRVDVPTIMAGLDCLVLTSTSEGFPNVIGEAMAVGVPCVATDAGDARVLVGDTGTIVALGDSAAVAEGVLGLMASSRDERHEVSKRCRARIAENFEIHDIVARYAAFYRGLNEERNQRQPRQ